MAADGNPEGNLGTGNHSNGGEESEKFGRLVCSGLGFTLRQKKAPVQGVGEKSEKVNRAVFSFLGFTLLQCKKKAQVRGVGEKAMKTLEREIYHLLLQYADNEKDSPETKEQKGMARAALTMWKESAETHQRVRLEEKSEIRDIMNEVYQLLSLYSIFVGVVLTAVATSSRLECEHLWSPVGLTLFSYCMVIFVAITKFLEIRELREEKKIHKLDTKDTRDRVLKLKESDYAAFDFDRDCQESRELPERIPYIKNALGLLVPLTIFTVGIVFSLIHILCWS